MRTTLATPVRRPDSQPVVGRLAEIQARYPDALAWYGEKSGLWLAAPAGAAGLIQAKTAAGLAYLLDEHYRQYFQSPRPTHLWRRVPSGAPVTRPRLPEQGRQSGGTGVVARSLPPSFAAFCTVASATADAHSGAVRSGTAAQSWSGSLRSVASAAALTGRDE